MHDSCVDYPNYLRDGNGHHKIRLVISALKKSNILGVAIILFFIKMEEQDMNWGYANMSHEASINGGPNQWIESIKNDAREDGHKDMIPLLMCIGAIGSLIGGFFTNCWNRRKKKKYALESEIKLKQALINNTKSDCLKSFKNVSFNGFVGNIYVYPNKIVFEDDVNSINNSNFKIAIYNDEINRQILKEYLVKDMKYPIITIQTKTDNYEFEFRYFDDYKLFVNIIYDICNNQ